MQRHYHILIVDDDPKVLFILCTALEKLGNRNWIETAADGRQALAKAQNQPFDLIISDVKMPGISGIQLVEMIRALNIETELIWITAYGCESLKAECERLNVLSCMEKPLRIKEIRATVRAALKVSSARKTLKRTEKKPDRVQFLEG